MAWDVEYTDEFEAWWVGLDEEEQIDIAAVVGLLEEKGPHLPYPYSSDVKMNKEVHYEQTILYIERENETRGKKKSSGEDKDLA